MKNYAYDAVVVGSGPNGLAAAIYLAQQQLSVLIVEAAATVGGGVRSAELTLPGFTHDICSTIHLLAIGSPFFNALPLDRYGLEYVQPPASVAHPFDDGTAALLESSVEKTAAGLGADAMNYRKLFAPLVENWRRLAPDILAPLRFPNHPWLMAGFGLKGLRSARGLAESYFSESRARALFGGVAAHSMIPLEAMPSAAIGLVLTMAAHAVGWGFPRGGAGKISAALAAHFLALGGRIETDRRLENVDELPTAPVVLFNLTPRQILKIAGHRLPDGYRTRLEKFRYGAGAFKMDFALSEPISWRAAECRAAATVHLGGTFDEISVSEAAHERGAIAENPFVLLAQNSLFDESRAPAGQHTAWAYCHVPNNSAADMTNAIENQIERFAPGFRDCILAKKTFAPADLESYNGNYVGGDINGGASILSQLLTRPMAKINPYAMPVKGFYICSASTPPGGGVHGMSGYHAARTVMANEF